MPPVFDPEWEYWSPDPEIAELFAESARSFASLGIESFRTAKRGALEGFRFGRGNPDHCRFRLAPEKVKAERALVEPRDCKGCGRTFRPDRQDRWYCSRECVPHPGARRTLPDSRCPACGVAFRPSDGRQVYCSLGCSARGAPRDRPRKIDDGEFRRMYLAGAPLKDMMERFGVQKAALKVARRRLGIPARPAGSPRRGKG